MLLEAALLLAGGLAFGAMFARSGLWDYTKRVFAETQGTLAVLRDRRAGDAAKERAARAGTLRFARFGIITLLGMGTMFAISAVPMAAAVLLGLTTTGELWLASIHPAVIIAGVAVFVIGTKL